MNIGLIITILAIIAFLTGLVWMIFIRSDYPKFTFRKFGRYYFVKSTIGTDHYELVKFIDATLAAKCAYIVYKACEQNDNIPKDKISKIKKRLSNVFIAVRPEHEYVLKARVIPGNAAIAVYDQFKNKIYSTPTPYVTINSDMARSDIKSSLLIHEYLHGVSLWCFGGEDALHKNEKIWQELQKQAEMLLVLEVENEGSI